MYFVISWLTWLVIITSDWLWSFMLKDTSVVVWWRLLQHYFYCCITDLKLVKCHQQLVGEIVNLAISVMWLEWGSQVILPLLLFLTLVIKTNEITQNGNKCLVTTNVQRWCQSSSLHLAESRSPIPSGHNSSSAADALVRNSKLSAAAPEFVPGNYASFQVSLCGSFFNTVFFTVVLVWCSLFLGGRVFGWVWRLLPWDLTGWFRSGFRKPPELVSGVLRVRNRLHHRYAEQLHHYRGDSAGAGRAHLRTGVLLTNL